MIFYFEVPGKPQGKARARTFYNPRIGKSQSITPGKTAMYENWIKQCFIAKYRNLKIEQGHSLVAYIDAYFKIPKSTSKKKVEQMVNRDIMPCKKPDLDNIAKVVCDALNGLAYHDDAQIVSLRINKYYTKNEPKIIVGIDRFKKEREQNL